MTNSVPGLGWPEDEVPTADPAGVRTTVDADADAWLAQVARSRQDSGMSDYGMVGRTGALPDRYARRASRMGLGWPGRAAKEGPRTGRAAAPRSQGAQPAEGEQQPQHGGEVGLGSSSAAEAAAEPVPERVRRALASVSRETHERFAGPQASTSASRSEAEGTGRDEGWRGSGGAETEGSLEGGQLGESEDQVAFPAVPDASADTPIDWPRIQ